MSRFQKPSLCSVLLTLTSVLSSAFVGCGGEDVSQPPSAIAERLAKAKQAASADPPKPATPPAQATENSAAPISLLEKAKAGDQEADKAAAPVTDVPQDNTVAAVPTEPAAKVDTGAAAAMPATETTVATTVDVVKTSEVVAPTAPAPAEVKPQSRPDAETMTVGGKTKEEIDAQKEKNESVASSGMSLLDKLRGGDKEKKKSTKKIASSDDDDVDAIPVTRFGRFAVAARTWLQLQNQLAKRFYVAATDNGRRLAASSGLRSVGVLSTQVEVLGTERVFARTANNVIAQTLTKQKVFTQSVRNLPGQVKSLELIQNGDVVLIGTLDGRLLARSCANLQDWDIYAQDLFAFQDEHRPATQISDSAVVAVRAISEDRLLTITENNECAIWKMSDVVHAPIPILEMTEDQAKLTETSVLKSEPLATVDIRKSRLLNLAFSKSRKLCAVVSSDEYVTVFNTDDGVVSDSISAAELNDTQPVSAVIDEARQRITIGLADGRIFRRALAASDPISATDEDGKVVDYEVVFSPDLGDRAGAITAMAIKHDDRVLYIGRLDGSVTLFDLPRKQLLTTSNLHKGPVIEFRSTLAGLFSIGDDRLGKLSDLPVVGTAPPNRGTQQFDLPKDAGLAAEVLVEEDDMPKQDKFTRARNFGRDVAAAKDDEVSLVGIRPPDAALALYEHQLRVATDPEIRGKLRQQILKQRNASENNVPTFSTTSSSLFAELPTQFDYQARPLRRAIMAVSDDGMTLGVAQYFSNGMLRGAAPNQPVMVWDTPTRTMLRTWRRSPGVMHLRLRMNIGTLLPTPLSAQLNLYDGQFKTDPQAEYLSWDWAPNTTTLAVGLRGVAGMASNTVQLLNPGAPTSQSGVDAFEGIVSAIAYSADGASLFVNVRERTQIRLLQLASDTLQLQSELVNEPIEDGWKPNTANLEKSRLGATHLLPSPDGKMMVSYGRHAEELQLRIWKNSGDKWPQDKVIAIPMKGETIETTMTDTPFTYVNNQTSQLAIIGAKGIGILSLRTGKIENSLELSDVEGRRPVTLFTPDGKQLLVGDQDGKIWTLNLRTLEKKPTSFTAHAGPIVGMTMSRTGQYLVTAGQENLIRVWDLKSTSAQASR